jgi:hypothetical protein
MQPPRPGASPALRAAATRRRQAAGPADACRAARAHGPRLGLARADGQQRRRQREAAHVRDLQQGVRPAARLGIPDVHAALAHNQQRAGRQPLQAHHVLRQLQRGRQPAVVAQQADAPVRRRADLQTALQCSRAPAGTVAAGSQ